MRGPLFKRSLRADERVPFKGHFDLVILSVTPVDGTHVRFDAGANVQATHLGNAGGPGFFILDLATLAYVGEATWAANGDEVFLTFSGQFVPTTTPGLFDSLATFEVTGGTGRFAGATGHSHRRRAVRRCHAVISGSASVRRNPLLSRLTQKVELHSLRAGLSIEPPKSRQQSNL